MSLNIPTGGADNLPTAIRELEELRRQLVEQGETEAALQCEAAAVAIETAGALLSQQAGSADPDLLRLEAEVGRVLEKFVNSSLVEGLELLVLAFVRLMVRLNRQDTANSLLLKLARCATPSANATVLAAIEGDLILAFDRQSFSEALGFARAGLELAMHCGALGMAIKYLEWMSNLHERSGDWAAAVICRLQVLRIRQQSNPPLTKGAKRALEQTVKKLLESESKPNTLVLLSSNFIEAGECNLAVRLLLRAADLKLTLDQPSGALRDIQAATRCLREEPDDSLMAECLRRESTIYERLGEQDKARSSQERLSRLTGTQQ